MHRIAVGVCTLIAYQSIHVVFVASETTLALGRGLGSSRPGPIQLKNRSQISRHDSKKHAVYILVALIHANDPRVLSRPSR